MSQPVTAEAVIDWGDDAVELIDSDVSDLDLCMDPEAEWRIAPAGIAAHPDWLGIWHRDHPTPRLIAETPEDAMAIHDRLMAGTPAWFIRGHALDADEQADMDAYVQARSRQDEGMRDGGTFGHPAQEDLP